MRVDRNAAAVVGHRQKPVGLELDLDPARRGPPPPRPWSCRSPRRRGGASPFRRCRRYTCRGGGGRAPAPPAPRCRRPCSSRRRKPRRGRFSRAPVPRRTTIARLGRKRRRGLRIGPCGSLIHESVNKSVMPNAAFHSAIVLRCDGVGRGGGRNSAKADSRTQREPGRMEANGQNEGGSPVEVSLPRAASPRVSSPRPHHFKEAGGFWPHQRTSMNPIASLRSSQRDPDLFRYRE